MYKRKEVFLKKWTSDLALLQLVFKSLKQMKFFISPSTISSMPFARLEFTLKRCTLQTNIGIVYTYRETKKI